MTWKVLGALLIFNSAAFAADPPLNYAQLTAAANHARETAPHVIAPGPFQPTWQSLESQYQCPEWFRDAKFGIWAHWGPSSAIGDGDWYARNMYMEGSPQYEYHLKTYG